MVVPLKYLNIFWRTFKILLIYYEINIFLTWSVNCIIVTETVGNQITTFAITETKLFIPVVTLSAQDNARLLQQIETGLKRKNNWNK